MQNDHACWAVAIIHDLRTVLSGRKLVKAGTNAAPKAAPRAAPKAKGKGKKPKK